MAGNLVQGAVFTVMVVRAGMLRDPAFEFELAEQVRRSPRFFLNAPVVLDLKDAAEFTRAAEFAEAREILRRQTLTLIGVQNTTPRPAMPALPALRQTRLSRAAGRRGSLPRAHRPPPQRRPGW
jgi:septum site-determining protein MinC